MGNFKCLSNPFVNVLTVFANSSFSLSMCIALCRANLYWAYFSRASPVSSMIVGRVYRILTHGWCALAGRLVRVGCGSNSGVVG